MRPNVTGAKMRRRTANKKVWMMGFIFMSSLFFLLFQGGKLANMLFLIVTLLILYISLGKWSGVRAAKGTRTFVNVNENDTLAHDTKLHVKVHIHIPGFWPIPYLMTKDGIRNLSNPSQFYTYDTTGVLGWNRNMELEYKTAPLPRGVYVFDDMKCFTEDIFGFFQHEGSLSLHKQIKVLPKTVHVRKWTLASLWSKGIYQHTASIRHSKETTQIDGVRDYVYGDKLSKIHWNMTAKTGNWKSKEFERESMPKMYVILDVLQQNYVNDQQFETAVSTAASILNYGHKQGLNQGLMTSNYHYFAAARGEQHYTRLLHHLIEVHTQEQCSVRTSLETYWKDMTKDSLVIIVSPQKGEDMVKLFTQLKMQRLFGCHIVMEHHEQKQDAEWRTTLEQMGTYSYAIENVEQLPQVLGGASI
ncbi:DUF58 domain-containing protein [Longirhabdus pacifica]|uniref:DUF58 domain-containing protein n=1 Tax=Longirhabdus pacifica TaxID=2305227 RepID=UPI001008B3B0|nr:DUF58 domain-containing protein [Longirhabdus pacifica]